MSLRVLRPGALTTVQDLGRHGFAHLGVPAAGAADAPSLRLANRLVGNREDAAGLEITLSGPRLRFEVDTAVALVGARLPAHVDDVPVAMGQTVVLRAGQILTLGAARTGVRAYLAVAGGIRVAAVLGSRAGDTLAGLGPPALAAGQVLPIRARSGPRLRYLGWSPELPAAAETPLRVILGPRADRFAPAALETLLSASYTVGAHSDRTGLRLAGPTLARVGDGDLDSEGMVSGGLQVPPDGQPILLLVNHGTTGGYPVIATLIAADLGRAAQIRPGQRVRFVTVSQMAARRALADQARQISEAVVDADARLLAVRELVWLAGRSGLAEITLVSPTGRLRLRR